MITEAKLVGLIVSYSSLEALSDTEWAMSRTY